MKKCTLWWTICIGLIFVVLGGCRKVEHIYLDEPSPQVSSSVPVTTEHVRVLYDLAAEFPSGGITPDAVSIDGKVFQENELVRIGRHTFVVEKKGYQTNRKTVDIDDPDRDGKFQLTIFLNTKPRVVHFDIRDKNTRGPLVPDLVEITPLSEGQRMTISHNSYVKPGRKQLVIQKSGYRPITDMITINPDEEPYRLVYEMTPQ